MLCSTPAAYHTGLPSGGGVAALADLLSKRGRASSPEGPFPSSQSARFAQRPVRDGMSRHAANEKWVSGTLGACYGEGAAFRGGSAASDGDATGGSDDQLTATAPGGSNDVRLHPPPRSGGKEARPDPQISRGVGPANFRQMNPSVETSFA